MAFLDDGERDALAISRVISTVVGHDPLREEPITIEGLDRLEFGPLRGFDVAGLWRRIAQDRQTIAIGLNEIEARTKANVEAAAQPVKVDPSAIYDRIRTHEERGHLTDLAPGIYSRCSRTASTDQENDRAGRNGLRAAPARTALCCPEQLRYAADGDNFDQQVARRGARNLSDSAYPGHGARPSVGDRVWFAVA